MVDITSLDQSWIWCEAWCDTEDFDKAKIIDLCGDPHTYVGETKIDKLKRLIPSTF